MISNLITFQLMTGSVTKLLSPQAAADRARCSRSTIMRAIETGKLRAERDNSNRWKVDPEALDIWSKNNPVRMISNQVTDQTVIMDSQSAVENAVLATKLELSEERRLETVAALDAEREKSAQLLAMVQELAKPRWPWSRRITLPQSTD